MLDLFIGDKVHSCTQPMEKKIQTQGEILVQSKDSRAFAGVYKHKEFFALKIRI